MHAYRTCQLSRLPDAASTDRWLRPRCLLLLLLLLLMPSRVFVPANLMFELQTGCKHQRSTLLVVISVLTVQGDAASSNAPDWQDIASWLVRLETSSRSRRVS